MKKLALALALMVTSSIALAETFTYIVPAKIDGGTAKWAQKFTKEWNKQLAPEGHDIVLRYISNQSGRGAFTKWHTELSDDNTVLIQSKGFMDYITAGGWKGFDPTEVNTIGGQLQGTFVFIKKGADLPYNIPVSGNLLTDTMGHHLIMCGNMSIKDTIACGNDKFNKVMGWKGMGEMRKAYLGGELEIARDGFSHMKKTYKKELKSGKSSVFYSHGTVHLDGSMGIDPNTDGSNWFNKAFYELHGEEPKGEFYDAYLTLSKMRSGLGKTVFTKKDNPYYDMLTRTFDATLVASKKTLDKKLGIYPWHTGAASNVMVGSIWDSVTDVNKENIKRINIDLQ